MSSGINYSKFDNIQISSSDEETIHKKPHITTLNNKDRVVIGPNGLTVLKRELTQESIKNNGKENNTQKQRDKIKNGEVVKVEEHNNMKNKGNMEDKENEKNKNINKENNKEKEEKLKKEKQIKEMVENGSVVPHQYIWSQSSHDVIAHLVLPKNTKAKELFVEIYDEKLIVKKKDCLVKNEQKKENMEEMSNKNNKNLSVKNECKDSDSSFILINKMFPFKVCTKEETQIWEIKNMKVNWQEFFDISNKINKQDNIHFNFENDSLINNDETFLYISLKKNNEIGNCYIWWPSLFKGESQINVANLPARASITKQNNLTNFKNIWDQAHQKFKENISKKKLPIPLD